MPVTRSRARKNDDGNESNQPPKGEMLPPPPPPPSKSKRGGGRKGKEDKEKDKVKETGRDTPTSSTSSSKAKAEVEGRTRSSSRKKESSRRRETGQSQDEEVRSNMDLESLTTETETENEDSTATSGSSTSYGKGKKTRRTKTKKDKQKEKTKSVTQPPIEEEKIERTPVPVSVPVSVSTVEQDRNGGGGTRANGLRPRGPDKKAVVAPVTAASGLRNKAFIPAELDGVDSYVLASQSRMVAGHLKEALNALHSGRDRIEDGGKSLKEMTEKLVKIREKKQQTVDVDMSETSQSQKSTKAKSKLQKEKEHVPPPPPLPIIVPVENKEGQVMGSKTTEVKSCRIRLDKLNLENGMKIIETEKPKEPAGRNDSTSTTASTSSKGRGKAVKKKAQDDALPSTKPLSAPSSKKRMREQYEMDIDTNDAKNNDSFDLFEEEKPQSANGNGIDNPIFDFKAVAEKEAIPVQPSKKLILGPMNDLILDLDRVPPQPSVESQAQPQVEQQPRRSSRLQSKEKENEVVTKQRSLSMNKAMVQEEEPKSKPEVLTKEKEHPVASSSRSSSSQEGKPKPPPVPPKPIRVALDKTFDVDDDDDVPMINCNSPKISKQPATNTNVTFVKPAPPRPQDPNRQKQQQDVKDDIFEDSVMIIDDNDDNERRPVNLQYSDDTTFCQKFSEDTTFFSNPNATYVKKPPSTRPNLQVHNETVNLPKSKYGNFVPTFTKDFNASRHLSMLDAVDEEMEDDGSPAPKPPTIMFPDLKSKKASPKKDREASSCSQSSASSSSSSSSFKSAISHQTTASQQSKKLNTNPIVPPVKTLEHFKKKADDAQRNKEELQKKKQELQKKKNEEWKQKAEKIRLEQEKEKKEKQKKLGGGVNIVSQTKPGTVLLGKPPKPPTTATTTSMCPPSRTVQQMMEAQGMPILKPVGLMKPFAKPAAVSHAPSGSKPLVGQHTGSAAIMKTPVKSASRPSDDEVFKTPMNTGASFLDQTNESFGPLSSYDITRYEDLDEDLNHRTNKPIPEWAQDKMEVAIMLFKQLYARDVPPRQFIFPKPERGYRLYDC